MFMRKDFTKSTHFSVYVKMTPVFAYAQRSGGDQGEKVNLKHNNLSITVETRHAIFFFLACSTCGVNRVMISLNEYWGEGVYQPPLSQSADDHTTGKHAQIKRCFRIFFFFLKRKQQCPVGTYAKLSRSSARGMVVG
jgi:hypothetical protein